LKLFCTVELFDTSVVCFADDAPVVDAFESVLVDTSVDEGFEVGTAVLLCFITVPVVLIMLFDGSALVVGLTFAASDVLFGAVATVVLLTDIAVDVLFIVAGVVGLFKLDVVLLRSGPSVVSIIVVPPPFVILTVGEDDVDAEHWTSALYSLSTIKQNSFSGSFCLT